MLHKNCRKFRIESKVDTSHTFFLVDMAEKAMVKLEKKVPNPARIYVQLNRCQKAPMTMYNLLPSEYDTVYSIVYKDET